MDKNFKIIYSKKLMEFLVSQHFEVIEVVPNKHKTGFIAWKFKVSDDLLEAINIYNSYDMEFADLCNFISQQALEGRIYKIIDRSDGTEDKDCIFKVNEYGKIIYKFKKELKRDDEI